MAVFKCSNKNTHVQIVFVLLSVRTDTYLTLCRTACNINTLSSFPDFMSQLYVTPFTLADIVTDSKWSRTTIHRRTQLKIAEPHSTEIHSCAATARNNSPHRRTKGSHAADDNRVGVNRGSSDDNGNTRTIVQVRVSAHARQTRRIVASDYDKCMYVCVDVYIIKPTHNTQPT